ncbi:basic amino acid ABC transporter substrate-binding protein [Campylobacter geochelonis]|uniref:basic amino acid ABC transporter substrate-binding protein n=1 Tax=Campylobacter geochelonis TaxID=1780362 RepID=UPI0007709CA1|nr:basic amino acid ABC transporter substrate-binding protein [Campylobacter geochelonis]CZE51194.1 arginine-binding periplasmic protein 1 [Campylobacter geochelonis]
MKKFLISVAILVAGFGYANAGEVLKFGTNATYPPFEYIDENSKVAGFDIDLVNELSKRVDFEYEMINMSFDGLIPALKSGKIDAIVAAMSATPERKKAVDFTKPYYHTENLYILKADNGEVKSKDDLKGKKIGVQLGTAQEQTSRKLEGVKTTPTKDIFTSILALKNGKIDAVLVDTSIGYGYLRKNSDLVEFLVEPDGSEGFSIAFDKDKNNELIAKIDAEVEKMKEDGSYEALLKKYELK